MYFACCMQWPPLAAARAKSLDGMTVWPRSERQNKFGILLVQFAWLDASLVKTQKRYCVLDSYLQSFRLLSRDDILEYLEHGV